RRVMDRALLPSVMTDLGRIPMAAYVRPGTSDPWRRLDPVRPKHAAILLENHAVVTCGRDLTTAYERMETVEQFARILLTAQCLGGPHLLSRAEVQKLIASRSPSRASSPESTVELTLEPR